MNFNKLTRKRMIEIITEFDEFTMNTYDQLYGDKIEMIELFKININDIIAIESKLYILTLIRYHTIPKYTQLPKKEVASVLENVINELYSLRKEIGSDKLKIDPIHKHNLLCAASQLKILDYLKNTLRHIMGREWIS